MLDSGIQTENPETKLLSHNTLFGADGKEYPSEESNDGCRLRPIVSINLNDSGYSLERIEKEDGSISFNLKK